MTDEADPSLIGRVVANKYVIEKHIGGGSMGAVYRARQTSLDKVVALKVLHRSLVDEPTFVARFHREAKTASRLDHPNSMRVVDFGEEPDGLLYIAMEYLEGRDLFRVMQEDWPLSDARIADILGQALAALAVAHDMGVIHRDLKPENIMVLRTKNDEGNEVDVVKVCDFGIAKLSEKDDAGHGVSIAEKLTSHGLVIGTPEYLSPEQGRGEKLDARSDLYSIGVLLYQLLSGHLPFVAESPLAIVLMHVGEVPKPPRVHFAQVNPALEAVCMRALSKNPADRFQTARDMRLALKAAVEGDKLPSNPVQAAPVVAAPAPPVSTPSRSGTAALPSPAVRASTAVQLPSPPRRSSAILWIVLALVVVGVAVAAVLGSRFDRSKLGFGASSNEPTTTVSVEASPPPTASSSVAVMPSATAVASDAATKKITPAPHRAPAPSAIVEPVDAGEEEAGASPSPSASASAAPFDRASCKAEAGTARAVGAAHLKDFGLGTAADAWTRCARSGMKDRPASPIKATVSLKYAERSLRGVQCTGCPATLERCIESTTGKAVSFTPKGDPPATSEFAIPMTIRCE